MTYAARERTQLPRGHSVPFEHWNRFLRIKFSEWYKRWAYLKERVAAAEGRVWDSVGAHPQVLTPALLRIRTPLSRVCCR